MELFTSSDFPNSIADPFVVTSPSSGEYNCIAWALNDQTRFIWPLRQRGFYWPQRVPAEETLEAFTKLFATKKYQVCEGGSFEAGFQKLALFEKDGIPTHAARQLSDGKWTSKIGGHIDVRHSLSAMEGGRYGNVALFFKKPI